MFRCSSAASCFLGLFCSVYHFVCLSSVFCVAFCSSARTHHPQCVPSIPRRLLSLLCRPPYVPCRRFYPCASYIQPHTHPLRPRLQLAVPRPPPFVPPSLSPPLTTVSCIFRSVYLPLLHPLLGRARARVCARSRALGQPRELWVFGLAPSVLRRGAPSAPVLRRAACGLPATRDRSIDVYHHL